MEEKLDKFILVQKELEQTLALLAVQLRLSEQVVSDNLPKVLQLFQQLKALSTEIDIQARS